MDQIPEKKRRGRKAKISALIQPTISISNTSTVTNTTATSPNLNIKNDSENLPNEKIPKKRGRKPKGGKVVQCNPVIENIQDIKINIILHLKCNLSDIQAESNTNFLNLENYKFSETKLNDLNYMVYNYKKENIELPEPAVDLSTNDNMKIIWQKLEKLSNNLHINNIGDKRSACFHCTYDFDNVPIYIPKHELNKIFHVYGCFCSPECACAFLMNEKNIDTTTRFERYQLLNFLYCKIYNYTKNIKPAPSPFYTLDKYFGNLSIQEYRKLFKNERLLLIVDKPLTRILPELHEDSDDYLLNYQGIPSSSKYSLQHCKAHSKNTILNDQFNISIK